MLPLSLFPNWDVTSEPNTSVLHRVNTDVGDVCFPDAVRGEPFLHTRLQLTLVGAVGVSLIAVIPTVVVPVARPVLRDAAAPVAFKLDAGAGMAAAGFVAVIATVVVCHTRVHVGLERSSPPPKKKNPKTPLPQRRGKPRITVVAAPVDVDAAAVGAGELGQREAGGVG